MLFEERARKLGPLAHRLLQHVAQLDRAERVEPRLHQRRVGVDLGPRRAAHHFDNGLEGERGASAMRGWCSGGPIALHPSAPDSGNLLSPVLLLPALQLEARREGAGGRVVEDERTRKLGPLAHRLLQHIAQLDRAERVEPRLHQRRVGVDFGPHRPPHQVEHRQNVEGWAC